MEGRSGGAGIRRLVSCVCAAGLLALLTACSRDQRIEAGQHFAIKFWNGFTGPDGTTMERMVQQFQQENPGIRVEMQIIPWAQYYDKLTLGLAFNRGPDLFVCHANRVPEFASYGALKEVEPQSAEGGPDESDFMELPWNAAHFEGRLFGIPLDCYPMGLYYNRALFRAAGLDPDRPPRTWEEFLAAAKRLTIDSNRDGAPDQWGFAVTNRETNWYTFAKQHGGGILTPDLQRPAIDSPESVAATEKLLSLITVHRVAPSPEGSDAWLGFRQGRVAMVMEGIYMLADLEKTKDLEYDGAPTPQFGPIRATWAGSHVLCIPARASSAKAAAAAKLRAYLSDHSLQWAKGGQVPARRSALQSPEFQKMRVQRAFASQLSYVVYDPPSVKMTEISQFIPSAIEAALFQIKPPRAALREAAARIQKVLNRP